VKTFDKHLTHTLLAAIFASCLLAVTPAHAADQPAATVAAPAPTTAAEQPTRLAWDRVGSQDRGLA